RTRLQWTYRSYYASVAMVDYEIGRILDELDRSGKANDTIVIFSTDHGDQLLEHGLEGKNLFFEASVHIPFVVRFPGRVQASRPAALVEQVDVVPTLLEWCGLPIPVNVQGRSFASLATGVATYREREAAFAENIIPEVITGAKQDFFYVPGEG